MANDNLESRSADDKHPDGTNNIEMASINNEIKIDEKLPAEIMSDDVEMTDLTKKESEPVEVKDIDSKESQNDNSADVNIDHKTFCTLGHFHLLLEDYEKGNFEKYV